MIKKDYIIGLIEGEGCFSITINDNNSDIKKRKRYVHVYPHFQISLHNNDRVILEKIKETIEVGTIRTNKYTVKNNVGSYQTERVDLIVSRISDCIKLIKYLGKSPFLGEKNNDYKRWMRVVEIKKLRKHDRCLTTEDWNEVYLLRISKKTGKGRRQRNDFKDFKCSSNLCIKE